MMWIMELSEKNIEVFMVGSHPHQGGFPPDERPFDREEGTGVSLLRRAATFYLLREEFFFPQTAPVTGDA
jgi:hypothetical protein